MCVYFQQVLLLNAGSEPFPHPRWLRRIDHTEISVNRVLTPRPVFFSRGILRQIHGQETTPAAWVGVRPRYTRNANGSIHVCATDMTVLRKEGEVDVVSIK